MFIGFMLVRSVILSEVVFPIFRYHLPVPGALRPFIGAAAGRRARYWWLGIVNGILLCLIGCFFFEAGWVSDMLMVSFLTSIAFIYWGFTIAIASYEMKPDTK